MGVREEVGTIAPLDGLRAIAALWVIVFHYAVLRDPADPWIDWLGTVPLLDALVRNGYLGVDLFFLISGFLLTLPWFLRARAGQPLPAAREFYTRRVRRIVPAYYVHLVLLFALFAPWTRGWDYWIRDPFVVAGNIVAHAGFLHMATPFTAGSLGVNGALWTLAIEAQYYLVLPLLASLFLRAPWWGLCLALLAATLWRHGAAHGLGPLVALEMRLGMHWGWSEATVRHLLLTQLPSFLGHFALGMLAGRLWVGWRERAPMPHGPAVLRLAAVAGLAVLLHVLATGRAVWAEHTWLLTTLALGSTLFAAAASRGPIAQALLGRGPLAFVGRVSYSAYLYHLPLLLVWNRHVDAQSAASLPLYLLTVLAVAWLSWWFVEQRFIGGMAGLGHRPRGPAAPRARSNGDLPQALDVQGREP